MAVPVEDPLLHIARVMAEPLELQSGLQIPEEVDVTALDVDTVGEEDLRESRQAINGRSREDRALVEELLEECIEDLWRLLP